MLAPSNRGSLSTNPGSLRHSSNRKGPNPLRSMRFRYWAGMIWSVSTSDRSSGTAVPSMTAIGSIGSHHLPDRKLVRSSEPTEHRGGGGDGGTHQMGAPTLSLAPLEVAV